MDAKRKAELSLIVLCAVLQELNPKIDESLQSTISEMSKETGISATTCAQCFADVHAVLISKVLNLKRPALVDLIQQYLHVAPIVLKWWLGDGGFRLELGHRAMNRRLNKLASETGVGFVELHTFARTILQEMVDDALPE